MSENDSTDANTIDYLSGSDVNRGSCLLSSNGSLPPKPSLASGNSRSSKLCPALIGSVSRLLGKEYVKAKVCSFESAKPSKLDTKLLTISDNPPDIQPNSISEMQKNTEDFLIKMLEDGSQLDRDVIGEVLGIYGSDVKKSFEKLMEFSALASKEMSNLDGESSKKVCQIVLYLHRDKFSPSETLWPQKMFRDTKYAGGERSRLFQPKSAELTRYQMEKQNQEKEILATLFCVSKIYDDNKPRLTTDRRRSFLGNTRRRSGAFGVVVTRPPDDFSPEDEAEVTYSNCDSNDKDEDNAYEVLRKAVLEHRRTMREYYRAAVEAYANGDQALAEELLEQGRFYQKKAHEADEESNEKIYETWYYLLQDDLELIVLITELVQIKDWQKRRRGNEFSLDLCQQDPKEAVSLMKRHLLSLPGIYTYLKVIIESNGVDTSARACRRRILKLLEKESIEWTETAGTISIALDKVQRECLSFYKKKSGNKFPS